MQTRAAQLLGPDYEYLAPDVVSRVCEDWRYKETPNNDRARIETRLRSKASDLRKSERRLKLREELSQVARPTPAGVDPTWWLDLDAAINQLDQSDDVRAVVVRIISGYKVSEIAEELGRNRYWVMKQLEPVGRLLRQT